MKNVLLENSHLGCQLHTCYALHPDTHPIFANGVRELSILYSMKKFRIELAIFSDGEFQIVLVLTYIMFIIYGLK